MNKLQLALLCLILVACDGGKRVQETSDITVNGDVFTVSPDSPVRKKIRTVTVGVEPFSSEFRTVGTVRAITGQIAEIAAPFDGRIVASSVKLGQKVGRGTPLFSLNSSDFYEASKTYFTAKKNNDLAQKNYCRKKELRNAGIVSERDLEEAETEAENARAEYEQAAASMKIFNVNTDNFTVGQPLAVVSPIAGEVVKCNITVGQYVKSDDEPVATVADLSKVWVVALVKEKYFGAIKKGDKAEVITDAQPDKIIWGNIYHISEMLDEETRSVEVLVECDNASRELKPGMFTAVHFQSSPKNAIVIPSNALFQNGDETCVFVVSGDGVYERRKVTSESVDTEKSCIIKGLTVGETIVGDGGIFLR